MPDVVTLPCRLLAGGGKGGIEGNESIETSMETAIKGLGFRDLEFRAQGMEERLEATVPYWVSCRRYHTDPRRGLGSPKSPKIGAQP